MAISRFHVSLRVLRTLPRRTIPPIVKADIHRDVFKPPNISQTLKLRSSFRNLPLIRGLVTGTIGLQTKSSVCLCVCMRTCMFIQRTSGPWSQSYRHLLQHLMCEPHSSLLREHQVLLINEPSLQPLEVQTFNHYYCHCLFSLVLRQKAFI